MKNILPIMMLMILITTPTQVTCSEHDAAHTRRSIHGELKHAGTKKASWTDYVPSAETRGMILSAAYTAGSTVIAVGAQGIQFAAEKLQAQPKSVSTASNTSRPSSKKAAYKSSGSDEESDHSSRDDSEADSDEDMVVVPLKESVRKIIFRNAGELETTLNSNASKAGSKFSSGVDHYFTEEDPTTLRTQADLHHTFKLAQESKHARTEQPLVLDPLTAGTHKQAQQKIFCSYLYDHAITIEPTIIATHQAKITKATQKYERKIAAAEAELAKTTKLADQKRDQQLTKKCGELGIVAANTVYIRACAGGEQTPNPSLTPTHFTSKENYQALMAQIRETKKAEAKA